MTGRKTRLIWAAKLIFRIIVLTLVTWGISRTVGKAVVGFREQQSQVQQEIDAQEAECARLEADPLTTEEDRGEARRRLAELREQRFSLWQIDPAWLAACGVLYLLGSAPCWLFWHRTLRAMGQRPQLAESLRAFYVGHLGKYVPGKALVVVLRTGLVRSQRVDTTVAAISVFVETLTMMAVGALIAAVVLAARHSDDVRLLILAIGLMLCAGTPTLPPIFRRLVRLFRVRKANPEIEEAIRGLNYRLMLYGWFTVAVGWLLMGLSLWAAMRAMPMEQPQLESWQVVPQLTACVALAMVAGFLSLLPGGVGVREYVVMSLLAPDFGEMSAVLSAILLRLVWLVSEVAISGILYVAIRPREELSAEPTEL